MAGVTRPDGTRTLTDGLDASTRDLATGRVGDADAVQSEADA